MEEKKTKSVSQIMRAIRGKESQTKASHKLKTTVTTISRIESDKQIPGGLLALRMVKAGADIDEMIEAYEANKAS